MHRYTETINTQKNAMNGPVPEPECEREACRVCWKTGTCSFGEPHPRAAGDESDGAPVKGLAERVLANMGGTTEASLSSQRREAFCFYGGESA